MTLVAQQTCAPGEHLVSGTECVRCGKFISPFRPNVERHQSQLPPAENKFHQGNGEDGKHYWLTPKALYDELDAEFHFDFDPCPFPKPEGFDGLTCEWGQSNYVNPPFGSIPPPSGKGRKIGPTGWMRKAIIEQAKGKTVVLVYPVDKWVLMMTKAMGIAEIRNLGDVRWCAIEDGSVGKGTGRHIACFILRPSVEAVQRARLEKRFAGRPIPPCDGPHLDYGLPMLDEQ